MALGAQPVAVRNLELGRGLALAAAGVVLGVGGAYALTRLLAGFLFAVPANDLPTFAAVAALLALVAVGSSYVAAQRATKVNPLVALRAEDARPPSGAHAPRPPRSFGIFKSTEPARVCQSRSR